VSISGLSFFCSWSGGKDSALALYHALRDNGKARFLFTMLHEDGLRSRSHGLPVLLLEKQAQSLNIPLVTRAASWNDYEKVFTEELHRFKKLGVQAGVFGDIDLEEHRLWEEKVCQAASLSACLPLWQRPRRELAEEFIDLGFTAVIVAVNHDVVDPDFLGREYNKDTLADLERAGIDVAGEAGEFHTFVTGGPIFKEPIAIQTNRTVSSGNYSFLDWS
jgi:uncharacterized protein (TIGR00290 family)